MIKDNNEKMKILKEKMSELEKDIYIMELDEVFIQRLLAEGKNKEQVERQLGKVQDDLKASKKYVVYLEEVIVKLINEEKI